MKNFGCASSPGRAAPCASTDARYGCAVATLIGRMEDRRHYLSDLVFGATIGLAMGEAVIAQRRDVARHLKVDPDRVGLQIEF